MSALNPQGIAAAKLASPGSKPGAVEAIVSAYLAVAFPQSASPEESGRFVSPDGVPMVSVKVAKSVPFAKALIYEWSLSDGVERGHMLRWNSISLPAAIYDAILDKARRRLRPGGLDE